MKFLFVADLHIHPFSAFSEMDETGLNSRSQIILDAFAEAMEYAVKNSIRDVFILGDVFHVRGRLYAREFVEFWSVLQRHNLADLNIYIIAGNHDYLSKASDETALKVLPVNVLANGGVGTVSYPHREVCFIPWRTTEEQLKSKDNKIPKGAIVVGHLAIKGGEVGSAEHIMEEGIDPKIFKDAGIVLLGHYHKRQQITDNVHFVGSLVPHDFGDIGEEGGFAVLDTDTLGLEYHSVSAPKFMSVKPDELDKVKVKGNYVRIEGSEQIDEESIRKKALKLGAQAVVFNTEKSYGDEARLPVNLDTDLQEAMKLYVDKEHGDLDPKRLVKIAEGVVGGS